LASIKTHQIVIIGSGFSGICMAIKLKEQGFTDILMLEKADEVGGTWRDNHYPGAECDVPSALYSYSFERKTDWDYQWSEQPQILEYIRAVVDKHSLRDCTRFNSEVAAASYSEAESNNSEAPLNSSKAESNWTVTLRTGEQFLCQYLISAVGQLHQPNIPNIEGAQDFSGPAFHSADWQHDIDLQEKSVGVIGNAASAVQFIPSVAKKAGQLTVFQRSANWVSEKRDTPYTEGQKRLMHTFPFIKSLARLRTYLRNELLVFPAIRGNRLLRGLIRTACTNYLNDTVEDPELRRKLTPTYPIGAKRILVVAGYYQAMVQDNVGLVTDAVSRIDARGIYTQDGSHHPCDIIIYGTGFITNPFLHGIDVRGRNGKALTEHWSRGASAYLGVTTHDFPNLFFLYGPNTNLGHNSIILMSEAQANFIVQAISTAKDRSAATIEVKTDVEEAYNKIIQSRLQNMVWSEVEDSWYKSGDKITNNWPGSVGEYRRVMRHFDPQKFLFN
jgi:cation diffusion facilitator CzcD-associated flavoprotein CzcO